MFDLLVSTIALRRSELRLFSTRLPAIWLAAWARWAYMWSCPRCNERIGCFHPRNLQVEYRDAPNKQPFRVLKKQHLDLIGWSILQPLPAQRLSAHDEMNRMVPGLTMPRPDSPCFMRCGNAELTFKHVKSVVSA